MHADDAALRSLVSVKPLAWARRVSGSGGEIWVAEVDGGEVRYVITLDGSDREPFMISRSTALTPFGQRATLEAAQAAADEDNRRRVLENLTGVVPLDLEGLNAMQGAWQRFSKTIDGLGRNRRNIEPAQEIAVLKAMARDLKMALEPAFSRLDVDLKPEAAKTDFEAQIRMLFPI
jgi:hypothetical protein